MSRDFSCDDLATAITTNLKVAGSTPMVGEGCEAEVGALERQVCSTFGVSSAACKSVRSDAAAKKTACQSAQSGLTLGDSMQHSSSTTGPSSSSTTTQLKPFICKKSSVSFELPQGGKMCIKGLGCVMARYKPCSKHSLKCKK